MFSGLCTHPVEIVVGLGFAQVQSLALVGGSPLQQVVEDVVVALVPPLRADPRLLQQILLHHRPTTQAFAKNTVLLNMKKESLKAIKMFCFQKTLSAFWINIQNLIRL